MQQGQPERPHERPSLSWYTGEPTPFPGYVAVPSPGPGVCDVELTFATGFTYSAEVTFASMTCTTACGSFIGPTAGPFMVNNPGDTCVALDAGDE